MNYWDRDHPDQRVTPGDQYNWVKNKFKQYVVGLGDRHSLTEDEILQHAYTYVRHFQSDGDIGEELDTDELSENIFASDKILGWLNE